MIGLAPLLLLFPFLGYLFNALVGRKFTDYDHEIGEKWSGWVAAGMSLLSFAISVGILFSLMADSTPQVIPLFDWIHIPSANFHIQWALHIDTLSSVMLMVITGVGSLIHIYAIGYMHGDGQFARFFAYLNLFLFFMLMLVTGSSYLVLFLGWEGVGLASFLLIGFWWQKDKMVVDPDREETFYEGVVNSNAARKAFVANRFGDLCMIVAMSLTFWTFGTMNFGTEANPGVFQMAVEAFDHDPDSMVRIAGQWLRLDAVLSAITALFLLGAAGKSAQIPFFVWLPDAMAGPTPVSALMHAATMVTSGIYLLVRSNVLLEIVRESHYEIFGLISSPDLVAYAGAITAVFAGLIAFTQFDIKKVLAYSTVSQLGFMIAAAGMGAYVAAMFHLVTHAFFKALLFMGAGSVIHGMEHGHHHLHEHGHGHDDHGHHDEDPFDPQDMRYMGNLRKHMPITFATYMIGAFALAGIFPFAGFWSKDEILAHAGANGFGGVNILLTIAAFCTAFYMGRQLKMTFFGEERHEATKHVPESVPVMTRPLVILAALSIIGGMALNLPFFSGDAAEAAGMHVAVAGEEEAHGEEESHGEDSAETHSETADDTHGATDDHGGDHSVHFTNPNLWLEHYLEPSIASFELSEIQPGEEKALLHLPHTPIVLDPTVAGVSTAFAVLGLALSFFLVYRDTPKKATDKDPIFRVPVLFSFMSILPLNHLYMKILRNGFNRFADFAGHTLDWDIWHDGFHNGILRRGFLAISSFLSDIFDRNVVDGGMVLGAGRFVQYISNALKQIQSGYVRNYALSLFLGVVALLVYFVFMA